MKYIRIRYCGCQGLVSSTTHSAELLKKSDIGREKCNTCGEIITSVAGTLDKEEWWNDTGGFTFSRDKAME